MTCRPYSLQLFLAALTAVALFVSGCAPRRIDASAQAFSASGIADFNITVSPPLTLFAAGKLTPDVPSDTAFQSPTATVAFALFAEGDSGPVERHAHTMFCELPLSAWRWEMETWGKREALLHTSMRAGAKNWTIQIFPVAAAGDWFSALWQQNSREVPGYWLAKRWSSTPEEEMRLLAEYREPAPACMRDRLVPAAGASGAFPFPKGKELRRGCNKEIEEFSARADAVFQLEKRGAVSAAPVPHDILLPRMKPDMTALAGRAESLKLFANH